MMFRANHFPNYRQLDQMDCGPTCVKIIAKHYGKEYHLDYLRQISNLRTGGVSLAGISEALKALGFDTIGIRADFVELVNDVPLPAIAHWENNHFVVVHRTTKKYIYVSDPAIGLIKYGYKEFMGKWVGKQPGKGILLLIEPNRHFPSHNEEGASPLGLKYLYHYLLPYKKYIGQLCLGLFIATIIQLLLPFLTQSLVDYGIDYENISFIYLVVIAQIFLLSTRLASEIIRDWLLLHMSTQINIAMISDFLDKLLLLPITYFDSKTKGDFMQRIYDHHRIEEFLGGRSLTIAFDLLSILVFGLVLGYFNTDVLLIFMIGTFLFVCWTVLFLKRKAFLDHKLFKLNRQDHSLLIQLISAVREIKLNGSEQRRKLEWKKVQAKLYRLKTNILKVDQIQLKGGFLLNEITSILIIFWSAKAVVFGEITLGTMLAIQFIVGSLSIPISNTLDFVIGLQRATLSLKRLSEVHSRQIEASPINRSNTIVPGDIVITNMDFGYGEMVSKKVLDNLSITIPKGKITAIVGHSGSGKTTFLKLLLKLYEPKKGSIRIGKEQLKFINAQKWREQCGAVLQDGILFNDTLERNITESRANKHTDKKRLIRATAIANLTELVENLPLGYDTLIGEEGSILSGGEKQRLLIARAIYKNPDYLFFDEATSALDAENEKAISENLKSFCKDKTIVIVAHRLSTVRNADQIIVMNKGKIVEKGCHQELKELHGRYHELIINQL